MKILLVTETLHAGGAETFVLRLCRKLRQQGYTADILNFNADIENNQLLSEFNELPIVRVHIPWLTVVKKIDRLFFFMKINFSLQQMLSERWLKTNVLGKYDVYHTHLIKTDYLFCRLKQSNPGMKLISTVHGDYSDFYYKAISKQPLNWLGFPKKMDVVLANINKWVVIADEQSNFFLNVLQVEPDRLIKFYNGFEPTKTFNKEKVAEEKFIIGMVARGVKLKGWDVLIAAFKNLPDNCELRLVGSGPYIDELTKKFNGHPRIRVLGFHPNPVEVINQFDVFVMPSLFPYESLPTVIMEALYCKKPVIATNVGEVPSMITDEASGERAGYLLDFDGKNVDDRQLYEYLMKYYCDRNLVNHHSAIAAKAFLKFNMDVCAKNYISQYEDVLHN